MFENDSYNLKISIPVPQLQYFISGLVRFADSSLLIGSRARPKSALDLARKLDPDLITNSTTTESNEDISLRRSKRSTSMILGREGSLGESNTLNKLTSLKHAIQKAMGRKRTVSSSSELDDRSKGSDAELS